MFTVWWMVYRIDVVLRRQAKRLAQLRHLSPSVSYCEIVSHSQVTTSCAACQGKKHLARIWFLLLRCAAMLFCVDRETLYHKQSAAHHGIEEKRSDSTVVPNKEGPPVVSEDINRSFGIKAGPAVPRHSVFAAQQASQARAHPGELYSRSTSHESTPFKIVPCKPYQVELPNLCTK